MLAGLKMPVIDSGKEQVGPIVGRDDGKVCFTFFMLLSWVENLGSTSWMGGPSVVVDNDDRRSQLELCSHICLYGSHICFIKSLHLSRSTFPPIILTEWHEPHSERNGLKIL